MIKDTPKKEPTKQDTSSKIIDLKPRQSSARSKSSSNIEYQESVSAPSWMRIATYGFFGTMIAFYLLSPIWDVESNDLLNLSLCLVFVFVLWILVLLGRLWLADRRNAKQRKSKLPGDPGR